jgi:hypothetical protein
MSPTALARILALLLVLVTASSLPSGSGVAQASNSAGPQAKPYSSGGALQLDASAGCSATLPGKAKATFRWTPIAGSSQQWVDLSLFDNGFRPGTFIGAGPLAGSESTFTWEGLLPEALHYWRVNSFVGGAWQPSQTGVLVTPRCVAGAAVLLEVRQECSTSMPGTARVEFRWQPAALVSAQQQWLDLSLQDNDFLRGTFIGAGPLPLSSGDFSWDGIKPGLVHHWRVNTMLGPAAWVTSEAGRFTTLVCALQPVQSAPGPTVNATPSPTAKPLAIRKMILIQGIDSSSSCNDDPTNPNSFAARRASVLNALASTGLDWDHVYGFSYGDAYADCIYGPIAASGAPLTWPAVGLTSGMVTPIYTPTETCNGVRDASVKLGALVDRLIGLYPGARFDLVAHSMGGLVASYYVATQDPSFIAQRIHSVILLDSPVNPGLSVSNPRTACGARNESWPDMSQGSSIIATINLARTTLRTRFVCVLATEMIGQALPGCPVVYTQNYTSGTEGAVGGTIGGVLGCLIFQPLCVFLPFAPVIGDYVLDTAPVHSAVWHDPAALRTIAETVLGP